MELSELNVTLDMSFLSQHKKGDGLQAAVAHVRHLRIREYCRLYCCCLHGGNHAMLQSLQIMSTELISLISERFIYVGIRYIQR